MTTPTSERSPPTLSRAQSIRKGLGLAEGTLRAHVLGPRSIRREACTLLSVCTLGLGGWEKGKEDVNR